MSVRWDGMEWIGIWLFTLLFTLLRFAFLMLSFVYPWIRDCLVGYVHLEVMPPSQPSFVQATVVPWFLPLSLSLPPWRSLVAVITPLRRSMRMSLISRDSETGFSTCGRDNEKLSTVKYTRNLRSYCAFHDIESCSLPFVLGLLRQVRTSKVSGSLSFSTSNKKTDFLFPSLTTNKLWDLTRPLQGEPVSGIFGTQYKTRSAERKRDRRSSTLEHTGCCRPKQTNKRQIGPSNLLPLPSEVQAQAQARTQDAPETTETFMNSENLARFVWFKA